MNYVNIKYRIMFRCQTQEEIKNIFQQIATNVRYSSLLNTDSKLFIVYSNIYARVKEEIKYIPHKGMKDHFNNKEYDGTKVYENLLYAEQFLASQLKTYINSKS